MHCVYLVWCCVRTLTRQEEKSGWFFFFFFPWKGAGPRTLPVIIEAALSAATAPLLLRSFKGQDRHGESHLSHSSGDFFVSVVVFLGCLGL